MLRIKRFATTNVISKSSKWNGIKSFKFSSSSSSSVTGMMDYSHSPTIQYETNDVKLPIPSSTNINFTKSQEVFQSKKTSELLRAYLIFQSCRLKFLVKHSDALIKFAYTYIPGKTITNKLMKMSFFGHFCAGESREEIHPIIQGLAKAGIGGILDYAAEADVQTPRDLSGTDRNLLSARTYDYKDEALCDANAKITHHSIRDAKATAKPGAPAFAAIKCTALGKPELLMRMSSIIVQAQLLFGSLEGPNLSRSKSNFLDKLVDYPTMLDGFRNAGVALSKEEILQLFKQMDKSSRDGVIDYIDWVSFLDPMDLTMGPLTQFIDEPPLTEIEKTQLQNMIRRLEGLASDAAANGVKLMVDAEQTYMQKGIDHLVLNLQRKYNRNGQDVIYNTTQCYLKISDESLSVDLERARREGFRHAVKLVRGAYMVQERKRAKDLGYLDPIHKTLEDTHRNYNHQIEKLLRHNADASFMVASHNVDSVKYTINLIKEFNIDRVNGGVYFGQLLGMCDHVSYALGSENYRVFKYVPYGPVQEVLPYLVRRAQENSTLMNTAGNEIDLLREELVRRIFKSA